MAKTNISFPVGRQRIGAYVNPVEAGATRDVRAQMAQIIKNAKNVIDGIQGATPEALEYAVQPIFETSQELCPVDTGKLKASGYVEVKQGVRGTTVVVGYAKGGNPYYAAIVHERMDTHHAEPTQAKFLEEAVNRHIGEIIPRYIEFIQNSTGVSE